MIVEGTSDDTFKERVKKYVGTRDEFSDAFILERSSDFMLLLGFKGTESTLHKRLNTTLKMKVTKKNQVEARQVLLAHAAAENAENQRRTPDTRP